MEKSFLTHPDINVQENGVLKGNLVPITLFNIKINDIMKCFNPGVHGTLYINDFLICFTSMNILHNY